MGEVIQLDLKLGEGEVRVNVEVDEEYATMLEKIRIDAENVEDEIADLLSSEIDLAPQVEDIIHNSRQNQKNAK